MCISTYRQDSRHWPGIGLGDDSDVLGCQSSTAGQKLQARHRRGPFTFHVSVAGDWVCDLRTQHLHQVSILCVAMHTCAVVMPCHADLRCVMHAVLCCVGICYVHHAQSWQRTASYLMFALTVHVLEALWT